MSGLRRLIACIVGLLLLAAPTAFACGELGAMSPRCPMVEMAAMADGHGPVGGGDCHGSGAMSEECCDIESAPEPMEAMSFASVKLPPVLARAVMPSVAPPAPTAQPPRAGPAGAADLHDLGRYTLFSSFLL